MYTVYPSYLHFVTILCNYMYMYVCVVEILVIFIASMRKMNTSIRLKSVIYFSLLFCVFDLLCLVSFL